MMFNRMPVRNVPARRLLSVDGRAPAPMPRKSMTPNAQKITGYDGVLAFMHTIKVLGMRRHLVRSAQVSLCDMQCSFRGLGDGKGSAC